MGLIDFAFSLVRNVLPKPVKNAMDSAYQGASDLSASLITKIPGDHAARKSDPHAISATANTFRRERSDAKLDEIFERYGMQRVGSATAGVEQAAANTCTAAQVQLALAANQPGAYKTAIDALLDGKSAQISGVSLSLSPANRDFLARSFEGNPERLASEMLQTALMEYAARREGASYDRKNDSVMQAGKDLGKGLPVAWQKHFDELGVTRTAAGHEVTSWIDGLAAKSNWLARLLDMLLPGDTEIDLGTLQTMANAVDWANEAKRDFVVNLKTDGGPVEGHAYRVVEVKEGKITLASVKTSDSDQEETVTLTPQQFRDGLLKSATARIGEYTGETVGAGASVASAAARPRGR